VSLGHLQLPKGESDVQDRLIRFLVASLLVLTWLIIVAIVVRIVTNLTT
jgi:hypothetical protein